MPDAPASLVTEGACPYLVAADGAWRMTVPDREHRCAAFVPATSLAPTKQARLCLTPGHVGCATYVASIKARAARTGSPEPPARSGRWALARTTPVVEQVGRLRATLVALLADRRTWPAIPAVLLATLLVALGLSGSWGETPVTAVATLTAAPRLEPTPGSAASASVAPATEPLVTEAPATPRPSIEPSPTPTSSPLPSASATVAPTPQPSYRTYTIKAGDTLAAIAQRFHTTVRALEELNGITDPTRLHIGEVLRIP